MRTARVRRISIDQAAVAGAVATITDDILVLEVLVQDR